MPYEMNNARGFETGLDTATRLLGMRSNENQAALERAYNQRNLAYSNALAAATVAAQKNIKPAAVKGSYLDPSYYMQGQHKPAERYDSMFLYKSGTGQYRYNPNTTASVMGGIRYSPNYITGLGGTAKSGNSFFGNLF